MPSGGARMDLLMKRAGRLAEEVALGDDDDDEMDSGVKEALEEAVQAAAQPRRQPAGMTRVERYAIRHMKAQQRLATDERFYSNLDHMNDILRLTSLRNLTDGASRRLSLSATMPPEDGPPMDHTADHHLPAVYGIADGPSAGTGSSATTHLLSIDERPLGGAAVQNSAATADLRKAHAAAGQSGAVPAPGAAAEEDTSAIDASISDNALAAKMRNVERENESLKSQMDRQGKDIEGSLFRVAKVMEKIKWVRDEARPLEEMHRKQLLVDVDELYNEIAFFQREREYLYSKVFGCELEAKQREREAEDAKNKKAGPNDERHAAEKRHLLKQNQMATRALLMCKRQLADLKNGIRRDEIEKMRQHDVDAALLERKRGKRQRGLFQKGKARGDKKLSAFSTASTDSFDDEPPSTSPPPRGLRDGATPRANMVRSPTDSKPSKRDGAGKTSGEWLSFSENLDQMDFLRTLQNIKPLGVDTEMHTFLTDCLTCVAGVMGNFDKHVDAMKGAGGAADALVEILRKINNANVDLRNTLDRKIKKHAGNLRQLLLRPSKDADTSTAEPGDLIQQYNLKDFKFAQNKPDGSRYNRVELKRLGMKLDARCPLCSHLVHKDYETDEDSVPGDHKPTPPPKGLRLRHPNTKKKDDQELKDMLAKERAKVEKELKAKYDEEMKKAKASGGVGKRGKGEKEDTGREEARKDAKELAREKKENEKKAAEAAKEEAKRKRQEAKAAAEAEKEKQVMGEKVAKVENEAKLLRQLQDRLAAKHKMLEQNAITLHHTIFRFVRRLAEDLLISESLIPKSKADAEKRKLDAKEKQAEKDAEAGKDGGKTEGQRRGEQQNDRYDYILKMMKEDEEALKKYWDFINAANANALGKLRANLKEEQQRHDHNAAVLEAMRDAQKQARAVDSTTVLKNLKKLQQGATPGSQNLQPTQSFAMSAGTEGPASPAEEEELPGRPKSPESSLEKQFAATAVLAGASEHDTWGDPSSPFSKAKTPTFGVLGKGAGGDASSPALSRLKFFTQEMLIKRKLGNHVPGQASSPSQASPAARPASPIKPVMCTMEVQTDDDDDLLAALQQGREARLAAQLSGLDAEDAAFNALLLKEQEKTAEKRQALLRSQGERDEAVAARAKAAAEEQRKALDDLQKTYAGVEEERDVLKRQVNTMEDRLQEADVRCKKLSSENDELSRKVEKLEKAKPLSVVGRQDRTSATVSLSMKAARKFKENRRKKGDDDDEMLPREGFCDAGTCTADDFTGDRYVSYAIASQVEGLTIHTSDQRTLVQQVDRSPAPSPRRARSNTNLKQAADAPGGTDSNESSLTPRRQQSFRGGVPRGEAAVEPQSSFEYSPTKSSQPTPMSQLLSGGHTQRKSFQQGVKKGPNMGIGLRSADSQVFVIPHGQLTAGRVTPRADGAQPGMPGGGDGVNPVGPIGPTPKPARLISTTKKRGSVAGDISPVPSPTRKRTDRGDVALTNTADRGDVALTNTADRQKDTEKSNDDDREARKEASPPSVNAAEKTEGSEAAPVEEQRPAESASDPGSSAADAEEEKKRKSDPDVAPQPSTTQTTSQTNEAHVVETTGAGIRSESRQLKSSGQTAARTKSGTAATAPAVKKTVSALETAPLTVVGAQAKAPGGATGLVTSNSTFLRNSRLKQQQPQTLNDLMDDALDIQKVESTETLSDHCATPDEEVPLFGITAIGRPSGRVAPAPAPAPAGPPAQLPSKRTGGGGGVGQAGLAGGLVATKLNVTGGGRRASGGGTKGARDKAIAAAVHGLQNMQPVEADPHPEDALDLPPRPVSPFSDATTVPDQPPSGRSSPAAGAPRPETGGAVLRIASVQPKAHPASRSVTPTPNNAAPPPAPASPPPSAPLETPLIRPGGAPGTAGGKPPTGGSVVVPAAARPRARSDSPSAEAPADRAASVGMGAERTVSRHKSTGAVGHRPRTQQMEFERPPPKDEPESSVIGLFPKGSDAGTRPSTTAAGSTQGVDRLRTITEALMANNRVVRGGVDNPAGVYLQGSGLYPGGAAPTSVSSMGPILATGTVFAAGAAGGNARAAAAAASHQQAVRELLWEQEQGAMKIRLVESSIRGDLRQIYLEGVARTQMAVEQRRVVDMQNQLAALRDATQQELKKAREAMESERETALQALALERERQEVEFESRKSEMARLERASAEATRQEREKHKFSMEQEKRLAAQQLRTTMQKEEQDIKRKQLEMKKTQHQTRALDQQRKHQLEIEERRINTTRDTKMTALNQKDLEVQKERAKLEHEKKELEIKAELARKDVIDQVAKLEKEREALQKERKKLQREIQTQQLEVENRRKECQEEVAAMEAKKEDLEKITQHVETQRERLDTDRRQLAKTKSELMQLQHEMQAFYRKKQQDDLEGQLLGTGDLSLVGMQSGPRGRCRTPGEGAVSTVLLAAGSDGKNRLSNAVPLPRPLSGRCASPPAKKRPKGDVQFPALAGSGERGGIGSPRAGGSPSAAYPDPFATPVSLQQPFNQPPPKAKVSERLYREPVQDLKMMKELKEDVKFRTQRIFSNADDVRDRKKQPLQLAMEKMGIL
eukprot:TRINITY_DN5015_c0_g2_i1.p1 TRINITY_DN5015_c0_g2~~TRINITY_DN5015_c0_g2_i1.p1  ORF type:complete len:2577 (+),score=899.49 TRINITY_DN5015_c0_g2_i1:62-7732(+)